MNKETLNKIRKEYVDMETNRQLMNVAFKRITDKMPIEDEDKKALNDAYQAILKNMGVIAVAFKESMKV